MPSPPAWPEEKVHVAISMWANGHSATIIGAHIGKSRNAVLGKLFRLKLLVQRPTKDRRPATSRYGRPSRPKRLVQRKPQSPIAKLLAEPFVPRPVPVIPEHERKSLIDLEDGDCRWPCTDGPPHAFCARPKVPGLVYCEAHARVAYTPARMPHTPIYAGRLTAHYDLHIVAPREKEDA